MPPTVKDVEIIAGDKPSWDFQIYDPAIADLLRDNITLNDKSIPIVFATPDRAFSQMRRRFKLAKDQNIPLPFISLSQGTETKFDNYRCLAPAIKIRNMGTDESRSISFQMGWPLPYDFTYTADIWVRNREEGRLHCAQMASIFEQVSYTYITVDHGVPIGTKFIKIDLTSINDVSSLDPGDGNRDLRFSFGMIIHGWLAKRVETVHRVHKIDVYVSELKK